jgi:hypothetical protein
MPAEARNAPVRKRFRIELNAEIRVSFGDKILQNLPLRYILMSEIGMLTAPGHCVYF